MFKFIYKGHMTIFQRFDKKLYFFNYGFHEEFNIFLTIKKNVLKYKKVYKGNLFNLHQSILTTFEVILQQDKLSEWVRNSFFGNFIPSLLYPITYSLWCRLRDSYSKCSWNSFWNLQSPQYLKIWELDHNFLEWI